LVIDVQNVAKASSTKISALEIATAVVTLKDKAGAAVSGVVVTFSEAGPGLLTISPSSKTALTNSEGQASVEIRAATSTAIGATEIGASASISTESFTAKKAIEISAAPSSGTVVAAQDQANAINFLDVNPADKSIVLAGSGGNGRSESATLRFRVVDKNNTPVKGVNVTFAAIPAGDVTLNIGTAVSDSDGVAISTVSSKSVATAVVLKATVDGKSISTQSDQLLVTTGVAVQAGFDLSASKFNLNYNLSGDSSVITVRIVDSNGNPVADGVPVVFTTNFGAVASSTRGGCTTLNGACTVNYTVQNPRPADGTKATVTASTRIGSGTAVSGVVNLIISDTSLGNIYTANSGGTALTTLAIPDGVCKATVSGFVGTPAGFPLPAGTALSVTPLTSNFTASVKTGSPVLDSAVNRTPFSLELDASSASLVPLCATAGTTAATAQVELTLTTGATVVKLPISVTYKKI
jgi:protocatechuate 3,4-dioxygenase beta subunit